MEAVGREDQAAHAFALRSGQPFAFGGVWDAWKDPATEDWLQSFSIITTDPNELTATVHDRMPVILKPSDYDRWLNRTDVERPPVDLLKLMRLTGWRRIRWTLASETSATMSRRSAITGNVLRTQANKEHQVGRGQQDRGRGFNKGAIRVTKGFPGR